MINSNKGCFWIKGAFSIALIYKRLTVTKVVFEFSKHTKQYVKIGRLTVTKVVFE